jgi:hypothetical protein
MSWTIDFTGASGAIYKYWNVDLNRLEALLDEPGNYGFLKNVGGKIGCPVRESLGHETIHTIAALNRKLFWNPRAISSGTPTRLSSASLCRRT